MTSRDLDLRPAPGTGVGRSPFGVGMNLLGVAVVLFWLIENGARAQYGPVVYGVSGLALVAWTLRELTRSRPALFAAAAAMVLFGAAASSATDSLLLVPVVVGIVALGSDPRLPVWLSIVAGFVATVEVGSIVAAQHRTVQFLLGNMAAFLLGVLVGISRRQYRVAEIRQREAEREQQRAELLADRSRAARDIHDVLAHSLGGLVLQLDAVEALLEAGQVGDARRRAGEARTLAAEGLAEARRAVHALRDENENENETRGDGGLIRRGGVAGETGPLRASSPSLVELVEAHRSFGGKVVTEGDLSLFDLDEPHAAAVVLAAREALSNARKHAPDACVTLSVVRRPGAVDVVIANPIETGGHGLVGMRERFEELHDLSTIEAERLDGDFVVAMHVARSDEAES